MAKYSINCNGKIDYLYYDHQQMPKSYSHSSQVKQQQIRLQEIKQNFLKALDDMINGPYKTKLLTGSLFSHISFGLSQGGQKGEIFKIGALVQKKQMTLDGIIYCNSQSEQGFIFGGKILDITKKPMMFVLNRGSQSQIVVGPNKIQYTEEFGQYRVQVPENYQGMIVSDVLSMMQSQNIIEIFVTSKNDNSIAYGQGQDVPNNFNQYQNMEVGFLDIIKDMNTIEQRNMNLSAVFNMQSLFSSNNSQPSVQNQGFQKMNTKTTSNLQPLVRKTQTQIIKEQLAAKFKDPQVLQEPQQQTLNYQRSSIAFNNNKTPQLNRAKAFTVSSDNNSNNNQFQSTQNSQAQFVKPAFNLNSNENSNPNVNKPFQFQFQVGGQIKPNNNQANPSFKPFQNNFKPIQAGLQLSNNLQPTYTSAFQQPTTTPKFQFIQTTQQQQPTYTAPPRPPLHQNFSINNQQTSYRPQSQPLSTTPHGHNQQPVVLQPTLKIGHPQPPHQQQQQQSTLHMSVDTSLHLPQLNKSNLIFSQLSLIDQETLKGYLKDLSDILNQEQLQKITALMLTDPLQFHAYYQAAHEQFQKTSNIVQSKSQTLPTTLQSQSTQSKVEETQSKKLRDFDDLTLFLLTIPHSLIKQNEVKYKIQLQQIKDCLIHPKRLLKELVIRKKYPINESFKGLLDNKQHADLIFILGNEEFLCHQIVFASNSDYFKRALKDSEKINKYQFGIEGHIQSKLLVPEWVDLTAFKLFILFMYTGKIGKDGRADQLSTTEIVNLLRIGNYFFLEYLQEQLIAYVIIPNMTPTSAVVFLKECTSDNKNHKQSCLNAWEFLKQYSYFYLQKHLPSLLRTNSLCLYELDISVMRQVIDKSLVYIVDGNKDLETILQFTADTWAEKNISKLFLKSQKSLDSCSAFDYQIVPQMAEFLKQIDINIDYKCRLIKSEDVVTNKSKIQQKESQSQVQPNNLDSTFIQGVENAKEEVKSDVDLSNWKPNSNILKGNITSKDIFDTKEPQFTTSINMQALKVEFEKNKGASVISKVFDFGRRSWHLKIDIDYENNVSLWIIERGEPVMKEDDQPHIGISIPVKFSSIIMEFELIDAAFGEYKSIIFYTFSHDSNQIIGHQNFINLSQLKDKNEINLKIHMKEFILHSAIVHYLSCNFQELYRSDQRTIEMTKNTIQSNKNIFIKDLTKVQKDYGILSLPFYNVFQILNSNDLKVDDENTILGYLFYYTKIQSITYNSDNMRFITDLLAQSLRFCYLSTKKILSALRDNEFLRNSEIFFNKTAQEFNIRVNNQNQYVLNITGNNSKSSQTKMNPRKYYDMNKIAQQGRKKNEMFSKDKPNSQPLIEELMDWLQNSKHNKEGESFLYTEIRKWQNLYYEEKSKNMALINQQALKMNVRPQSPQINDYRRNYRRSLSNDRLFETQESISIPKMPNNIPTHLRFKSPQRQPPAFLRTQQEPVVTFRVPAVDPLNYHKNNSFDQSRYMVDGKPNLYDSMKPFNGSILQAETKVRSNQYADFSQLLSNINNSNCKNKNNQDQFVPYYRQNKYGTNRAATTMSKCTKNCFLSLKEDNLLPTEERCFRNCFVKSIEFQEYLENEMRYTLRNQ